MKRLKKILVWGGISLGFIIAVLLLTWAVMNAIWGAELRKTIAEIKARGEPMTITELIPPFVPPEQNAAVELNKAFAMMCGDKPDERYITGKQTGYLKANIRTLNDFYPKMKRAGAEEIKKNLELVDSLEFTEIFALLKAAALKPGYNAGLKYEDGIAMRLPRLGPFRASISLLCLKALAQANKGNITGAGDTLMTAIIISNHPQNEPLVICQIVRIACLQMTAEALNNIADNFQIPEENAKDLITELEKINIREPLKKFFIAERVCFGQTIFNDFLSGKDNCGVFVGMLPSNNYFGSSCLVYFIFKIFIKKDYYEYLRIMSLYSEACEKPFYLSKEELERIETDIRHIPRYCVFSHLLPLGFAKVPERNAEVQTWLAISKIKLALLIYKGQHAAFPENLEQMKPEIIREIPIDELTGNPLTYKREGDKYVLFSYAVQKLEEERKLKREKSERELEAARKKAAGK